MITKEMKYIMTELAEYKIIGRLIGGSAAELYIIQRIKGGQIYVIKICAKEGVENGRKKLEGEINYLKALEISSIGMFAQVIDFYVGAEVVWYIMPYYKTSKTIREIICEKSDCKDIIFEIWGYLFCNLFDKNVRLAMKDFAIKRNINRVYSRMDECKKRDKRFERLCKYEKISINNSELYNYEYILQRVEENPVFLRKVSPVFASLTHDDLTIENVMVGEGKYIIIDPRGLSDTGYYRDYIYDIAKFTSTLSGFTTVKYGQFEVKQKENNITYILNDTVQKEYDKYYNYVIEYSKYYSQKYFPNDIYWKERLLFSEGCHYLSDIACRIYNGDEYEKLVAIYARGIEILNCFYKQIML